MLKALIKKQFSEIFKGYFVNSKTGKARSKGSTVGLAFLFAILLGYLGVVFFGMSCALGKSLLEIKLDWLYYGIIGTVAMLLGIFGSVFNTYAGLYLAKDNDLLLSMPIHPYKLLISRVISVYGLAFLYSNVVWIPAYIYAVLHNKATAISITYGVVLMFVIPLLVTALTCVLGFVVALFSLKIKNKGILSALFVVLFLILYYYVIFQMESFLKNLVTFAKSIGGSIKKWGYIIFQLGNGASGNTRSFLIFVGISLLVSAICFYILSKTFLSIATKNQNNGATSKGKLKNKQNSIKTALLKRELKRFTSSTTYLVNCGLGIIILPVMAIVAFIKYDTLNSALNNLQKVFPSLPCLLPIIIPLAVCIVLSVSPVATPSISLEGKNLWIYKSLPIPYSYIINAKLNLHILLNTPSAVISVVLLGICFKLSPINILLSVLFVFSYILLSADFCLLAGLKWANLNWTNEATPIKQSASMLVCLLVGMAIPFLVGFVGYKIIDFVPVWAFLSIGIFVFNAVAYLLKHILMTSGADIFAEL